MDNGRLEAGKERLGVRQHSGGFAEDIARGLSQRHDHGSQDIAEHAAPSNQRMLSLSSSTRSRTGVASNSSERVQMGYVQPLEGLFS